MTDEGPDICYTNTETEQNYPSIYDQGMKQIDNLQEIIEMSAFTRNIRTRFRPSNIKNWLPSEQATESDEERRRRLLNTFDECQLDMVDFFDKLITD